MNMNKLKNVRVYSDDSADEGRLNIYLDLSGRREYLMSHRRNPFLEEVLAEGIDIGNLRRNRQKLATDIFILRKYQHKNNINTKLKRRRNYSRRLERSLNHILTITMEYLERYNKDGDIWASA